MSPPVIYLDSQDYSRFGDVLRGKADNELEALFANLADRKNRGEVIFAVSMPILGEILQYDPDFRETSFKKAEAVERLCGRWALAYPSRLVAAEVANAAVRRGDLPNSKEISILSPDRYWFPNTADVFADLADRMREGVAERVSSLVLPTRVQRRQAKKAIRKFNPSKAAREAAPELAETYGLPLSSITGSLVPFLNGRISSEEASQRLFSAIAEPTKFVETYFERIDTDRSLPAWMGKFGQSFHDLAAKFRDEMAPFLHQEGARAILEDMLVKQSTELGRLALKFGEDDLTEFGIDEQLRTRLMDDVGIASDVPACRIMGAIVPSYLRQITGLSGTAAKIEKSVGGDLVHAFYLPHVTLWRGDRRFSDLARKALPEYSDRIVSKLTDLPTAIDALKSGSG